MTEPIDVLGIICNRMIDCNIASGNVYISDQRLEFTPPAVIVSESSLTGNTFEGFWEMAVTVNCIDTSDYGASIVANEARRCLDGWGGCGIDNISHTSTIPTRTNETTPVIHRRAVSFRVIYQELLV